MSGSVGIIIPVYNSEKTIKKCVKSVVTQSYRNLEVLLIDDGSTDRSGSICDAFEEKDHRIRVVHKENGGVSSARNLGLAMTNADYICFVDADDWLPRHAIQRFLNVASRQEADLIICCRNTIGGNNVRQRLEDRTITRGDKNWAPFLDRMGGTPWAKLYKRSIIKDQALGFPEGVRFGEDSIFLCRYLQHCGSIGTGNCLVYYENRLFPASASTGYYESFNEWMARVTAEYAKLVDPEYLSRFAERQLYASCRHYMRRYRDRKDVDITEKLQKSYELFKPYIMESDPAPSEKKQRDLTVLLQNNSFGEAESLLLAEIDAQQTAGIKQTIKPFVLALKRLWYYRVR